MRAHTLFAVCCCLEWRRQGDETSKKQKFQSNREQSRVQVFSYFDPLCTIEKVNIPIVWFKINLCLQLVTRPPSLLLHLPQFQLLQLHISAFPPLCILLNKIMFAVRVPLLRPMRCSSETICPTGRHTARSSIQTER
jgi:hypothetical protein